MNLYESLKKKILEGLGAVVAEPVAPPKLESKRKPAWDGRPLTLGELERGAPWPAGDNWGRKWDAPEHFDESGLSGAFRKKD